MLDDLRAQAGDSLDDQEEKDAFAMKDEPVKRGNNFMGMTPVQRLVLTVMFSMMICVLGLIFLVLMEAVYLPY